MTEEGEGTTDRMENVTWPPVPDENTNNFPFSSILKRCLERTENAVTDSNSLSVVTNGTPIDDGTTMEGNAGETSKKFQIDSDAIKSVPLQEQAEELQALGLSVYNQTEFEEGILQQVDKALEEQEAKRLRQIAERELKSVLEDIRTVKQRLRHIDEATKMGKSQGTFITKEATRKLEAIKREKENKEKQLKSLVAKQRALSTRVHGVANVEMEQPLSEDEAMDDETRMGLEHVFGMNKKESKSERMIRTGYMTPFGTVITNTEKVKAPAIVQPTGMTDFEKYLMNQEELKKQMKSNKRKNVVPNSSHKTNQNQKTDPNVTPTKASKSSVAPLKPPKRVKVRKKAVLGTDIQGTVKRKRHIYPWREEEQVIDLEEFEKKGSSGSEYLPSGEELSDDHRTGIQKKKKRKNLKEMSKRFYDDDSFDESDLSSQPSTPRKNNKLKDDGNQTDYLDRIRRWQRERLQNKHNKLQNEEDSDSEADYEELDGGYKIPYKIWNRLYKYQQTCVQWLWELHCQRCGGVIGDEMGLGKTIQVIAFLAGLWNSQMMTRGDRYRGLGPVIIVTPTTVMHQWVREFHTWWPPFRVAVLHESGSYTGTKESLIRHINNSNAVLITSYTGITQHQELLLKYDWHYIILDEGHKIRNPDAQATLAVKQFCTPHRVILSGSPLQNNLKELWSLFDFIFPGKLGTLPVFMQQFSVPITLGGYSNATQVQVRTAYKCAVVLRDTISPYLLRRLKSDVKMTLSLPTKNEQVLFCGLTDEQRTCYKEYLDSDQLKSIMHGRLKVFVGLIHLRKICNHPDLYSGGPKHFGKVEESSLSEEDRYGYWKRAGKMLVIESILKIWHKQGHRVLLFTQSRQMLQILEYFLKTREYTYMKMDGTTAISSRQPLINKYNTDLSIFVFLLTTRVGGLGVNLTGADRVVIYDPDWNPSTDLQARERAWRIGQQKNVTIYRLLTAGTIEEKIYHRQIFKQFLTNRVLKDPRQRRFFKNNELYELFTLQEPGTQGNETVAVFAGTGSEIKPPSEFKKDTKRKTDFVKKIKNSAGGHLNSRKQLATANTVCDKVARPAIPKSDGLSDKKDVVQMHIKTEKVDIVCNDNVSASNLKTSHEVMSELSLCSSKIVDITKVPSVKDEAIDGNCDIVQTGELAQDKTLKMKELAKKLSQQVAAKYGSEPQKGDASGHYNGEMRHIVGKSRSSELKADRNKHKKKKKSRRCIFEGEVVPNLLKQKSHETPDSKPDDEQISGQHDDYVLKKLFAKSGIQSALKHDVIMDDADPDYLLVEGEADRVAKEAVKILRQSRRHCFQADSGIPNWTGSADTVPSKAPKLRFGQKKNTQLVTDDSTPESTKLPESTTSSLGSKASSFSSVGETPSSSGVMSSSQLLARIKERSRLPSDSSSDSEDQVHTPVPTLQRSATEHDELLVDIRNFIAFQASVDGQASTQEILQHFKERLPPNHSAVFKALLLKICEFYRPVKGGPGMWRLNPEFR